MAKASGTLEMVLLALDNDLPDLENVSPAPSVLYL
jgi:hypothetical protein